MSYYEDGENTMKEFNPRLSKFNWGAFGFGVIWAAFNGAFMQAPMIFISMIICCFFLLLPGFWFIFAIALFGLSIYAGINGNIWAWDGKEWKDFESFEKTQKVWAIVWCILGALFWGFILLMFLGVLAIGNVIKGYSAELQKEGGPEKFVNRMLIQQAILKTPEMRNAKSGEEIAKQFHSAGKPFGKTGVIMNSDKSGVVVIQFHKDGASCSLEKKNCYLLLNDYSEKRLKPKLKTYYDDKGKTIDIMFEIKKTQTTR